MERVLDVYMDAVPPVRAGRLWARTHGGRETASFEYTAEWIRAGFAFDPELALGRGRYHTERALFNVFTDPAPDRWGQTLLRRQERARARAEGRAPRTLFAVDFLAQVDDATRLGALRFRDPADPSPDRYLTPDGRIPPLVELPRLLRAASAVLADSETDEQLALLLAPGTSLGGARPKASVVEPDGRLAIAKFPGRDDEWPITRWEAATLAMAEAAGIDVPPYRLVNVLKKPVLVVRRFDRIAARRVPYCSGLTALAARDGELRSYLELADWLRTSGRSVSHDLAQLWRRIAFNVLVSNTDDHLRNHGFLHHDGGWTLAPAFDLNPMPTDVKPRIHALALDEGDPTASADRVLSILPSFGLALASARKTLRELAAVTARWRTFGTRHGLTKRELERMASAFEHADLAAAARK